ncbi:MAG: hypothetical protein ACPLZ8_05980 [Fervidicoccaceae archaeon]
MSSEEDLKRLLDKLIADIISKISLEPEQGTHEVGPTSPNGIYFLDGDSWKLLRSEGLPLHPGERGDGIYVFYFDNTKCPACRKFDTEWFPFVKENANKAMYFIILCDWFARECSSKAASLTFMLHEVRASPTTIFFKVKNGEVRKQEKIEGVVSKQKLEEALAKIVKE